MTKTTRTRRWLELVLGGLNGVEFGEQEEGTVLANDGEGNLTATKVGLDQLDSAEAAVDSPDRLPIAELDDGESIEIAVRVPDGQTLEVYRWGAFDVSDGTAPTGLDVELLDGGDTVQASENTPNTEDTENPVAGYENTSGSVSVFKLRAKNDTGSAIDDPGVGSHFGYVVV